MKMALCIYGHGRTFEFCAPSIKKLIIEPYNPDIFVCSDYNRRGWETLYKLTGLEIAPDDEINRTVGDRGYPFGEWVSIPKWPQYYISISRQLNYLYRGWRCREMFRLHEAKYGKYDVVVVTRPDVKFLGIEPIEIPAKDRLYLPRIDAHQWEVDKDGLYWNMGYSSHTWWSSSSVAKQLLDGFHWTDWVWEDVGVWCGEMMLKYYCDRNGIKVIHTDVTQMIIKGDKNHPLSNSFEFGKKLSATHYPEYCDPPLPPEGHIPVSLPKPGGKVIGGHPPGDKRLIPSGNIIGGLPEVKKTQNPLPW